MDSQNRVVTLSLKKSQSSNILTSRNSKQDFNKGPLVVLQKDQKSAINRIVKELMSHSSQEEDLSQIIKRPYIQSILKDEFRLQDSEIKELEVLILKQCSELINKQTSKVVNTSHTKQKSSESHQVKSQPLTLLQKKELERQQTLDYLSFPAQPCVRSLYYVSKIAQTQTLKMMVPPSVIIGFGNDNRLMYNDYNNGNLVIDSKNISPKRIQKFIDTHMINGPSQSSYSIEDKLIYPMFVIKLAAKGSTSNDIRLYYSRDAMIADLLSFWGSIDLALQAFVKQKHPLRPSIYRMYINKNGNVYKALAINNQENVSKDHRFYKTLLELIAETHQQSKRRQQNQKQDTVYEDKERNRPRTSVISERRDTFVNNRRSSNLEQIIPQSIINEQLHFRNPSNKQPDQFKDGECKLDAKGFPTILEQFKYNEYFNELQRCVPNSELKRAFLCTSDNIENLTMMNCRPSALQQAMLMTMDLFRLFSQYYLKIQRFGNISQFVCDFIEDQSGLMYFLQVKSFECEGILHDWQIPFNPNKTNGGPLALLTQEQIKEVEEDQFMKDLQSKCQAQIICKENKQAPQLQDWLIDACKQKDFWEFNLKRGQFPMMSERIVKKYHTEVEIGKESFCLQSEKQRISILFPLTTFCDQPKNPAFVNNNSRGSLRHRPSMMSGVFGKFQNGSSQHHNQQQQGNNISISESGIYSKENNISSITNGRDSQQVDTEIVEPQLICCLACYKVLELFSNRYYALVFKTEQTVDELRRLKLRLMNHWTAENIQFIIKVYKESKKSLYIVGDIGKVEKRFHEQAIRDRAKSPDSVAKRSIRTARRPNTALRNEGLTRSITHFDQLLTIDSEANSRQKLGSRLSSGQSSNKRTVMKSSLSLLRSIDHFHKHMENLNTAVLADRKIPTGGRPMSGAQTYRVRSEHQPIIGKDSQQPKSTYQSALKDIEEFSNTRGQILNIQTTQRYSDLTSHLPIDIMSRNNHQKDANHTYSLPVNKKNSLLSKSKQFLNAFGSGSAIYQDGGQIKLSRQQIQLAMIQSNQKSDPQMCEYFNNKRSLNRQQIIYLPTPRKSGSSQLE